MRVAPSTARLRERITDQNFTFRHITEEQKAKNSARQASLTMILQQGCGACCGRYWTSREDGGRIACPILEDPLVRIVNATDKEANDIRKLAGTCKVPSLYEEAHDFKRDKPVSALEVVAACPFLDAVKVDGDIDLPEVPLAEPASHPLDGDGE